MDVTAFGQACYGRPGSLSLTRYCVGIEQDFAPIGAGNPVLGRGGIRDAINASEMDRNVTVEYRLARGQYDQLPAMAAELLARPVSVCFPAPMRQRLPRRP